MGEIVDLRNRQPTSHDDSFSPELVQDLARFAEGLVTEKDIKRRYRFDAAVWESLGENEALFAAIEDEKTRRVRSGALKKERAQALVTSAPAVLGEILLDKNANAKHRIDSAKALDSFAVGDPEGAGAPTSDRFIIQINLGDTSLVFDKPIKPDVADGARAVNVDDSDSNDIDATPWGMFPAIAAKKPQGGGDGQPV